jgi:uncharacterized protein (TIGR02145 family)
MKKLSFSHFLFKVIFSMLISTVLLYPQFDLSAQSIENFESLKMNIMESGTNGSLEVVPNPYPSGINNSAYVVKFVRPFDGAVWSGFFGTLPSAIDFDTYNYVHVKVWKSRISPIRFKIEGGANGNIELESMYPQTVVNGWEDIVFDFSQATGPYSKIVWMPDFEDPLTLTEDITIYFDDIIVNNDPNPMGVREQVLNVDLTGVGLTSGQQVFLSGALGGIYGIWNTPGDNLNNEMTDPDADGIYSIKLNLPDGLIAFKVFIGAGWSVGDNAPGGDRVLAVSGSMVVNFVFGLEGLTIENLDNNIVLENYESLKMNLMEGGTNGSIVVVPNPDPSGVDISSYAVKFVRPFDSQPWSGFYGTLDTPVDFTTNKYVHVKVWKPRVSPVKFKIEGGKTGTIEIASLYPQTTINSWEDMVFDFSNADSLYSKIVFMPDFEDPLTLTQDITMYFDDILINNDPTPRGPVEQLINVDMSSSGLTTGQQVFISGAFGGIYGSWAQPGSNVNNEMSDPDGDGIYTITMHLQDGPIAFKFFIGTDWNTGDNYLADRVFTVNGNANLTYKWGKNGIVVPKPTAVIKKASTAPVVDGIIDAVWTEANVCNIDKSFTGETPSLGSSGQTTWQALWTTDGVYILLKVTDNAFYPNYAVTPAGNNWEYDKPEIYFDVNPVLTDGIGPASGQGHYQVAPGFTNGLNDGTLFTDPTNGWKHAFMVTEPDYIGEYFIPFSMLKDQNGLGIDIMANIGFDVTIIDRDPGDAFRNRAVWSNTGTISESYSNMDEAGTITFEGATSAINVASVTLTGGTISQDNGTLQILSDILPIDATYKNLTWTVANNTGRATISSTGLVTALMNGDVTVTATAQDGSNSAGSCIVTITGQVVEAGELNVIKNGNFDLVNANGEATFWGGWQDLGSALPQVVNGIAECTPPAGATNNWQYQFSESGLNALPNIDYIFSFIAWSDADRTGTVDFEDTPSNSYNRYGISNDPESTGSSEWNFNLTTTPTKYVFHVNFSNMVPSTIQKVQFMLAQTSDIVYIDSVALISVDDMALMNNSALTGTKTINPAGGDYISFAAAISDLNNNGVGVGGVTFQVAADAVFSDVNQTITTTGSASDPIRFIKNGAGANPALISKGSTNSPADFYIRVLGGDYITFDGIDFKTDPAAAENEKIEFGLLFNGLVNNGNLNITVQNCTFNQQANINTNFTTIVFSTQTVANLADQTKSITINNVTFSLCNSAIAFNGNAQAFISDITVTNNHFGTDSEGLILNGDVVALNNTCNIAIHHNTFKNITTDNFVVAIYGNVGVGLNQINNNKIFNLRSIHSGDANFDLFGIMMNVAQNAELRVYNNVIYDFDAPNADVFSGNYFNLEPMSLSGHVYIYNNTVKMSSVNPNISSTVCWAHGNVTVKNNIFVNTSVANSNSFSTISDLYPTDVFCNNITYIDTALAGHSFNSNQTTEEFYNSVYNTGDIDSLINANIDPNLDANLVPQNPSPVSDNGIAIPRAGTDFNDGTRAGYDIGAFEGDFGPQTDIWFPAIKYVPVENAVSDVVILSANITDNVGVSADPRLWFRKSGSADAFTSINGVYNATLLNYEFTFPALLAGEYEYFVCAQDAAGNIISNPAIPGLSTTNTGLTVTNPSANSITVRTFGYKIAQLETVAITNISSNTATSGGNITSDLGAAITSRGVCWSLVPNPTIADSKTTDGSGTGAFTSSLTGISGNHTYYIRAYATNSVGTAYGPELTFTTLYTPVNIMNNTPVTVCDGFFYDSGSLYGNYSDNENYTKVFSPGTPGNKMSIAFSSFSVEDSYDFLYVYDGPDSSSPEFPGSPFTGTQSIGTFTASSQNTSGAITFSFQSDGYVNGPGWSATVACVQGVSALTVLTNPVTLITSATVTSGGNAFDDGGFAITQKGVCWSTTTNPTVAGNKTIDGTGTGIYTSSITGLASSTNYYLKAYAINSIDTAYGNEISFYTKGETGSVSDNEGNTYSTIVIGTQKWMAENLKTGYFNDGSAIPLVTDASAWTALSTPGYCWYNNDETANKATYGALYNWYTVNTGKLCPTGWHVPSDSEWKTLEMYLGLTQSEADAAGWRGTDQGTQLKNTTGWNSGGNGTNTSGFSALPGGNRFTSGPFALIGDYGYWWSSSDFDAIDAWCRNLYHPNGDVFRNRLDKHYGWSVRCLKNSDFTGTKTINPNGGDYLSFTAAIADLNNKGVGDGGITFLVAADAVFSDVNQTITATGTSANPIKFIKDGAGANPVLKSKGIADNTGDFFIKVSGGDYISFDGIDFITDSTAAENQKIETGLLFNGLVNDGNQNITVQSCTFNQQANINTNFKAILFNTQSVSNPADQTKSITINNVIFSLCNSAVVFYGNAQNFISDITLTNNQFGTDSEGLILNGGVVALNNTLNIAIHHNTFENITTDNFVEAIAGNVGIGQNQINNNKIFNIKSTHSGDVNFDLYAIHMNIAANAELRIYNNVIYDFDAPNADVGSARYFNLEPLVINGGHSYIYNNTVKMSSANPNISSTICWASYGNSIVKNNIFVNTSVANTNSFSTISDLRNTDVFCNNITYIDTTLAGHTFNSYVTIEEFYNSAYNGGGVDSIINANLDPNLNADLVPQNPSPASNNGIAAPKAGNDFNDIIRTGYDIGAFEGDFGPQTDIWFPAIKYVPVENAVNDVVVLLADITDNVGVSADPRLWFRKSGSADSFTSVNGIYNSSLAKYEFTFPALQAGSYEYFVCARDAAGNIISNPAVSGLSATNTGLTVNNPAANSITVRKLDYKMPQIETAAVSNITSTSALCGGNITSDQGATVISRGVCWGKSPNPGLADSITVDGSGIGVFTSSISGLLPLTTYHVRAYATTGIGTVYGADVKFTTPYTSFNLPFIESFDASTVPFRWTTQNTGTGIIQKWTISNSANAGGAAYELSCTYQSVNPGTTRFISPAINTLGETSLTLTFKHMFDDFGPGVTLKVQSSKDLINWTNESWSLASVSDITVGPETITTTIENNLNSETTYIAFTLEGDLYQFDYWYIDNVLIYGKTAFAGGSGTEAAPFLIATPEDLNSVRLYTMFANTKVYFSQIADIDLGVAPWNTGEGWNPIGNSQNQFKHTYAGNGFTISNLYINRPAESYLGLFGMLDSASVTNVILDNVNISGRDYVGALGGIVYRSKLANISSDGAIAGRNYIGGLTGYNYITSLIESHSSGTLNTTGNWVGGLSGINYVNGLINKCYSTVNIVSSGYSIGGISGTNEYASSISNSYFAGSISGTNYLGGITGWLDQGSSVNYCYSIGKISGNLSTGGLVGSSPYGTNTYMSYWNTQLSEQNTSSGGEGRITTEMSYPNNANTYQTWDFTNIWANDVTFAVNNGYPYLRIQPVTGIAEANSTICSGSSASMTLSGYSGFIQWQQSADGLTNWVNVPDGVGGNSESYSTANLSSTTFYRAAVNQPGFSILYSNVILVTVMPFPANPGVISGLETVCQSLGSDSISYTVPAIFDATSYIWTLPEGATGISSINSISVSYGNTSVSGVISVKGNNSCGDGILAALAVTVKPLPGVAGVMAGLTTVCQGQDSVSYSVPEIANAAFYVWTLPLGAADTSSINSIIVNYGNSAVSGLITVNGNNSCGDGALSALTITVNPLPETPGSIIGIETLCQGQDSVSYSVSDITNAISYVWSLPEGAIGTSSINTISVDYSNTAVSGIISVKGNNSCGDGQITGMPVIVNAKPATPVIIQNGNILQSDVIIGNQWYNSIGLVNDSINQEYTAIANDTYYNIVTANGCISDTSNSIIVIGIGIETNDFSTAFIVYPNPVLNELIIESRGIGTKTGFEILNASGKTVYKGSLMYKVILQTLDFTPGVYLLKLENGKSYEYKKIIKE